MIRIINQKTITTASFPYIFILNQNKKFLLVFSTLHLHSVQNVSAHQRPRRLQPSLRLPRLTKGHTQALEPMPWLPLHQPGDPETLDSRRARLLYKKLFGGPCFFFTLLVPGFFALRMTGSTADLGGLIFGNMRGRDGAAHMEIIGILFLLYEDSVYYEWLSTKVPGES